MDMGLGLIEGYYGRPWSWADRLETMKALAPHGYGFFIHAPKADPFLRRRWKEPHPPEAAVEIRAFSRACAEAGVAFGVGLSPFEIYRAFDAEAKAALADKLAQLDDLGVRHLGILFDDMRGDLQGLARMQAEILHWVGERSRAERLSLCPTYYSDDPVLDQVFGQRPVGYLKDLGAHVDPAIALFWTGPEVCSREISVGHLDRVAETLRRKPLLWDNYPVNDGPRMSPHLHLRGFTGRPSAIGGRLAGHAVNPALQPVLSRIPALTLAESYERGEAYDYGEAFARAAEAVLGPTLADLVRRRLGALQDVGLGGLGEGVARLRSRFAGFDHPGAREIVAFLDGAWTISLAEMRDS